jgi:UDP-N-acetylglucosamine 1-carboxyvinyltransferase
MPKFLVHGGRPLKGTARIHGSKNATLPILAATLLTHEPCILHNVPDISDVHAFLAILRGLGAQAEYKKGTVTVVAETVKAVEPPQALVKQMRASILLLGPLLARTGEVKMFFPGGCVLGKRSIQAHTHALVSLGAHVEETETGLQAQAGAEGVSRGQATARNLKGKSITMVEASVTATENAVMAAVLAESHSEIHWAAMEPHVQDLCHFLNAMGAKIRGIGTPTLMIEGVKSLHGTEYTITSDYLEAGTLALAGLLTGSDITLENVHPEHLGSFWEKLTEAGALFEFGKESVHLKKLPKGSHFKPIKLLKTAVFPGFATDLQAPFSVLLTQANGESRIFETLFEGRLNYLFELEKMGAHIQMQNPQQATITGPTRLVGASINSCDIRAGAAMVLASLIAEGTTEIHDIRYIDRGYEKLDETLRYLGAKIERVE